MNYLEAQLIGITETAIDLHVMETLYSILYQVRASNGLAISSDVVVQLLDWVWRIGYKSPEVAVPIVMIAGYTYKTTQKKAIIMGLIKINNSFRISTIGFIAEEIINA
jgi:hypothetical protein